MVLTACMVASACAQGDDGSESAITMPTSASASGGAGSDSEDTGSESMSTSTAASTTADTNDTMITTDLTFDDDVQPILTETCALASCHDGTFPPDLSEGTAYAAIIGVGSTQVDLDYVDPGSSDDSYLWHKINGTQTSVSGTGAMMPLTGLLPAEDLATIGEWIDGGAPES